MCSFYRHQCQHFKYLSRPDLETVLAVSPLSEAYLHAIKYLYELVCEVSELWNRSSLSRESATNLLHGLLSNTPLSENPSVVRNIEENLAIALDMLKRWTEGDPGSRLVVRQDASAYLVSLIRNYKTLQSGVPRIKFDWLEEAQVIAGPW